MKKSKTVLALLDKPEKWIKFYLGRTKVFRKLRMAVHSLFPAFNDGGVVAFNDDPRTKFADVLRVVRLAKV